MGIYLIELIGGIRERLDDTDDDYAPAGRYAAWQADDSKLLWKNVELIGLVKRALREIATRDPVLEEGGDLEGCTAVVTANDPNVVLDTRILTVEQARLASVDPPVLLTKTTSSRLAAQYGGSSWITMTGTPTHYLEPKAGYLYLFPIPVLTDTLRMVITRGYSTDFSWTDVASEETPTFTLDDIDAGLFEALVVATCWLAYQKRDSDAYSVDLARDCERQLTQLVGPIVSARHLRARRENANLQTAIRPYTYFGRTLIEDD